MLLRLWSDLRPTIVFVTHDIDEAIYLSERVVVLTRAPAHISRTVEVALPRPRRQIETKEHPTYLEYRRLILDDVMAQTRPAPAPPAPAAR
jgi:NitT/TauT family transport system ATP-binding protein